MSRTWTAGAAGLVVGVALGWTLSGTRGESASGDGLGPPRAAREGGTEPLVGAPVEAAGPQRIQAEPGDLAGQLAAERARAADLECRLAELEARAAARDVTLDALEEPLTWLRELDPGKFGDLTAEELLGLRELDLSELQVSDEDLHLLASLPSLKSLTLRGTPITDAGLVHLVDAPRLEHLGLRSTAVTDGGMAHVRSMPALRRLDLNMCAVGDRGMEELRDLDLTFLRLNYTKVTDAGLVHLPTLRSLERLDLWGTAVTDGGLNQLLGHPSLSHLELGATAISQAWVEAFQAAHPDCYVRSRYGR